MCDLGRNPFFQVNQFNLRGGDVYKPQGEVVIPSFRSINSIDYVATVLSLDKSVVIPSFRSINSIHRRDYDRWQVVPS